MGACAICDRPVPRGRKACPGACAAEHRARVSRENGAKNAARARKPHPPKACAVCGELFGEGLAPSHLEQRKTCSQACGEELRRSRREGMRTVRRCSVCDGEFRGDRRTCSEECRKEALRRCKDVPPKKCEVCEELFYRKLNGHEKPYQFAKRRVCSRRCANSEKFRAMNRGRAKAMVFGVELNSSDVAELFAISMSEAQRRIVRGNPLGVRACGECGQPGHNRRSCSSRLTGTETDDHP